MFYLRHCRGALRAVLIFFLLFITEFLQFLALFFAFFLLLLSSLGWGHGTKVSLSLKAIGEALELFEDSVTGATLKRYLGAKVWSTEGGRFAVKVYLKGGEEVRYLCKEDHDRSKTRDSSFVCEKVAD